MPNIGNVLKDLVLRFARREIRFATRSTRRAVAQFRRDIAALKRQVEELVRRTAAIEKRQPQEPTVDPEIVDKARFRSGSVKSHRAKLGLSAREYGLLAGVSELTVYKWESGRQRPRRAQMARWLAVRSMGKREALQRLAAASGAPAAGDSDPAMPAAPRGKYAHTGVEMILKLLKGGKRLPARVINVAWRKEHRAGAADTTLGQLVKARKLKRISVKGQRGSLYALA